MTDLVTRAFEVRAEAPEGTGRDVVGIGVPWDVEINAGGYRERFQRDSVEPVENVVVLWGHDKREVIGRISAHESTERGFEIVATLSDTPRGNEVLTLVRDGVIKGFSVGFAPIQDRDEDGVVVRERVRVHEISLTPFPAYQGAEVLAVREASTAQKEITMTETVTPADVVELRSAIEDIDRKIETFSVITRDEEPAVDTRSAGEIVKLLAKNDEETRSLVSELQTRAYTGGTTADAPLKNAWVGDLTRIYDNSSGVLSSIFETGTLPADGLTIEYGQLKSNTMTVTEQVNQGDNLPYGKVELETKTAPVKTYGGYTSLSRQAIERSSLPLLNRSLEALAQAAGKRAKIELRAAYDAAVTARNAVATNGGVVVLGSTLAAATYNNWVSAIVDAAGKFDDEALNIDAMIVSKSVFKRMAGYAGSDGRPLLSLDGSGSNTVGTLNITALQGSFAGVPVVLDAGLTGDHASLVNGRAIRVYQSGLVSLQDENIINLSKDFSVYRYAAIATEIPAGIVPVKLAAS